MSHSRLSILWHAILLTFAVRAASASDTLEPTTIQEERTVLQLSLLNPVQLFPASHDVDGLRLTLIYGKNRDLRGVALGGIYDEIDRDLSGVQMTLVVGRVREDFTGIQMAAICSLAGSDFESAFAGVQTACFYTSAGGDLAGLQVAPIFGVGRILGNLRGIQIAGSACSTVGDAKGVQTSLIYCGADGDVRGVQFAPLSGLVLIGGNGTYADEGPPGML